MMKIMASKNRQAAHYFLAIIFFFSWVKRKTQ